MKVVLKLAELFDVHAGGSRGQIQKIVDFLDKRGIKLDRHAVSAMLHNEVKYLSLETLGHICDYLVTELGMPTASLPGALFELVPESFMEMLVKSRDMAFCLGHRTNEAWVGQDFVVANDSHLQSELLAQVLRCKRPAEEAIEEDAQHESADYHRLHQFFVAAPSERATAAQWSEACNAARKCHRWLNEKAAGKALIALGSNKVNLVVELILARAFSATPFESQDNVALAQERACPLMFRYRERDPKPPSFCGGMTLARKEKAARPGIYYETKDGEWKCCPCEDPSDERETSDAAFVCYLHRPNLSQVELACGGFSGRATGALATLLEPIVRKLQPPQFAGPYEVGLFIVTFKFPPGAVHSAAKPEYDVIRLDDHVVNRRLGATKSSLSK